jgi:hypothetical protein
MVYREDKEINPYENLMYILPKCQIETQIFMHTP